LDLRANQLTELPADIAKLPNLEKLDLRWNKSLAVPAWITELEKRDCIVYV
jgi:Leucine-rich repeat (LRR) protein